MKQIKVFFLLTEEELDILEKAALFEPWLVDNIDNAKRKATNISLIYILTILLIP